METAVNYIALSIPVFFLLIGIEILVARRQNKDYYRFNDSINDLSMGVLQQVTGVFTKALVFAGYAFLFEYARMFEIPANNTWTWVIGFLGVDFCYYWFHRLSHEINVIWASHIAHHQSEEYNLTVALRQGSFQAFFSSVFYWPLAIIGLPPLVFLALSSFNTLYQFWIHTRTIKTLGPIEWIFNTPSHHRVHHGCNPQYIDRNHAGTLIIWDRMFGTFEPEGDEVIYGVTKPLRSWNPVWANIHYFVDIARMARRTRSWKNKVLVWFMPPDWVPDDLPPEDIEVTPLKGYKYNARTTRRMNTYIFVQFVAAIVATVSLLFLQSQLGLAQQVSLGVYVVWTLTACGALFEARPWIVGSEITRGLATTTAVWTLAGATPLGSGLPLLVSGFSILSACWLVLIRGDLAAVPADVDLRFDPQSTAA